MSFCSECGTKLGEADRFCSGCGKSLKVQHTQSFNASQPARMAIFDIAKKEGLFLVPLITFEKITLLINGVEYEKKFKYGSVESISLPPGTLYIQAMIDFGLRSARSNGIELDSQITSEVTIKLTFLMMGTPRLEVLYR